MTSSFCGAVPRWLSKTSRILASTFLGSSLIGYFINYRQILLSADQKNYLVAYLLLFVFVIIHYADRDVRYRVKELGTVRGIENDGGWVTGIAVGEAGIVEVQHTYEEGREHLIVVDGAHGVVHL